ncbi:MAG: hypothetical protein AN483_12670 [Aphanizomenon flos-aquae MDT14a]|uniref:Uncharacterized protein n=1 Tax=Aphanizomenon flos-aquae WA102 TaxID=1710896 RepID=A0A1B7WX18_APHFL|nr:MAG: hypothetical protein AN483_12670 [Aphanizomenon flos-aquae MDT14a]OBQ41654.1 MAG: hypothetical protein AN484_20475 [Aphanizomenon flos-aquae WA102]
MATNKVSSGKHLKQFNDGIDLFYQSVNCPPEDTATKDGWLCAERIWKIKNDLLLDSRKKFNLV